MPKDGLDSWKEARFPEFFFFFPWQVRSRVKGWRSMLQMQLSETRDSTVTVLVFEIPWPANN